MTIITLLILSLACWRITAFLVNDFEQGPYKILTKFREWAMKYTDVFECIYCTSIWIGLFITVIYSINTSVAIILCLPFALSALTLVWDKWNG